jgi:hypothetical protein
VNNRKAIRVMLFALVVFGVFFTYTLIKRRDAAHRQICLQQLLQLEGAKEQYAIEHEGASPSSLDVLIPRYVPSMPECPSGGAYTLGDMQTGVVCSVAAHAVDWTNR